MDNIRYIIIHDIFIRMFDVNICIYIYKYIYRPLYTLLGTNIYIYIRINNIYVLYIHIFTQQHDPYTARLSCRSTTMEVHRGGTQVSRGTKKLGSWHLFGTYKPYSDESTSELYVIFMKKKVGKKAKSDWWWWSWSWSWSWWWWWWWWWKRDPDALCKRMIALNSILVSFIYTPENSTWNLKITCFEEAKSSSKAPFLGSMLLFSGKYMDHRFTRWKPRQAKFPELGQQVQTEWGAPVQRNQPKPWQKPGKCMVAFVQGV